ncbi:TonB family protein [Aestuariicella hydrocarbonica]|uniref:Protein TonB n=1 Tax=Pseudomaricurvus hydrocarbonicus TaxID=1470433 RepID=A0A9E5JZ30_9GAMM|nr:TonB family protein [Aestuariicella hydrocarbonica]NHO65042.1 TonB family protein [Aestuariicella hydrocarbonica]
MSCLARGALFALLMFHLPSALADSLLNGLSVHKELNKEAFIGALYTDSLSSNANELLNSSGRKRLELRVTAKRLSSRRLNSMWIEGMAINNPPQLLTAQANNMVAFTSLVKRSLKAGDVLSIRGAGNTVAVTLNDTKLGSIESADFFNMILRTWIGNVPLSSDFRDGLLTAGDVNNDLLAQFENIKPSAARVNAIANWGNPQAASADQQVASTKTETNANKPDPDLSASMAAPALTGPSLIEKPKIIASAPKIAPKAPAKEKQAAPVKPATVAKAPAQPKKVAKPAVAAKQAEPMDEDFDDDSFDEEDSGPALTAESLLSRQLYHSNLLKWTYQYIRYPKRAIARGQEGSVRVAVVIDRDGNLKNVAEVESSKHDMLNREALKAVERATPFPKMPDGIDGNEFAFSLPIQFKLP